MDACICEHRLRFHFPLSGGGGTNFVDAKIWPTKLMFMFGFFFKMSCGHPFPKNSARLYFLFCFASLCRLQWRTIESLNIRWGEEIWWNSNRNLYAVFKVVRSMGDYCILPERHCVAGDENLYGCLVARLDRCWRWAAFQWSASTSHKFTTNRRYR